jgi:hypothetical protein
MFKALPISRLLCQAQRAVPHAHNGERQNGTIMLRMACALAVLLAAASPSQAALPVLKSNSDVIDIRDGKRLQKAAWTVDSSIKLDTYLARPSHSAKQISFISDSGSIRFDTKPDHDYDFMISVKGVLCCHTRITTRRALYERSGSNGGPVEIPMAIKDGVLQLTGSINGSAPLSLIFDTGADGNVMYPSALAKGVQSRFDGSMISAGEGGEITRSASTGNTVDIAGFRWKEQAFIFSEKQVVPSADGVIGYVAFDGKILEWDFERMLLLVHDTLPAKIKGFKKLSLHPAGTLTAFDSTLGIDQSRAIALRLMIDTGANMGALLKSAFVARRRLENAFPIISKGKVGGSGDAVTAVQNVRAPKLSIGGFALRDVPVSLKISGNVAPTSAAHETESGLIGMPVLRRFHMIFDLSRDQAYLKPNKYFNEPFVEAGAN